MEPQVLIALDTIGVINDVFRLFIGFGALGVIIWLLRTDDSGGEASEGHYKGDLDRGYYQGGLSEGHHSGGGGFAGDSGDFGGGDGGGGGE